MIDNNLLQHWREYQQYKRRLKMVNMVANNQFPCILLNDNVPAILIITNDEVEKHIEVRYRRRYLVKIPLEDIKGYDQHQASQTITLTLLEEDPIILEFGDHLTLEAAFTAIDSFVNENVNLPTPPSSSSDEDINNL